MPNLSVILGKLKGLFGGGSSSDDASEVPDTSTSSESSSASEEAPLETPAVEKKLTLKDSNTIPLDISVTFSSTPPMTVEEKKASREK